jgi:hypothetical protein
MGDPWGGSWGASSSWGNSWNFVVIAAVARIFGRTTGGPITRGSTRGGILFKGTQR